MPIPAGALFPELDAPADLEALLERLQTPPLGALGSLLAAAGPLHRPGRERSAAALRHRLEQVLELPQPFAPFLLHAAADHLLDLEAALTGRSTVADAGALLGQVAGQVTAELHELALRTLVALLHRSARAGVLDGATPEARYDDFVRRTLEPAFEQELSRDFPLLVPAMHRAAARTVAQVVAVLDHLETDRPLLAPLGVGAQDRVVRLEVAAGDRHARGLRVQVLHLDSGRRLVHKPRDLGVDSAFQRVLTAVRTWSGAQLRTCEVLSREGYGWMEFVDSAPTAPQEELAYFERVGELTALLHVLVARDVHHSNVVSDGRGPVAIDLETLLHPVLPEDGAPAPGSALGALDGSVAAIGILPMVVANGAGGQIDLGGVGYRDGERSPFRSLVVRDRGRDDMRLVLEHQVLTGRRHAPTVGTGSAAAADAADALDRGFTRVWRAMAAHRQELRHLVASAFAGTRVRYLHNPTALYAQLLRLATHPAFQRDAGQRLLALQRIGLSRPDADPALARSELVDLAEGDVPCFSALVDGTELDDALGRPTGVHLAEPPLAGALRRIDALGAAQEEALQRRVLRLTFVPKLARADERTTTGRGTAGACAGAGALRRAALGLATSLADRFVATQLPGARSGDPATWVDPVIGTAVEDEAWFPGVLGTGLYNGTGGPALFLALAAGTTGSARYAAAARAVLEPVALRAAAGPAPEDDGQPVGAYVGLAGPAHVLAVAGQALDDPGLVAAAVDALDAAARQVPQDRTHDLIAGSAGLLAVALAVHRRAGSAGQRSRCLSVAEVAADHLVRTHPLGGGDPSAGRGYTGLGHGSAGVHPQLRRLAALLPGERSTAWTTLADRLARWTDEHLDHGLDDWYVDRARERRTYGWCHGAPGIALSHAVLHEAGLPPVAGAEQSLRRAARLVSRHGLGNNVTYCHGDTGNVEALARTAAVLDDGPMRRTARRVAAHLVTDVLPHHLASTRSRYAHTGCLMLGTSGAGHFLLRQIDPSAVPSVLTLD